MPDNDPMPTAPTVPTNGAPATGRIRDRRWPVVTAAVLLIALYAGLVNAYAIGGASTVSQAPVEVPAGGVGVVLTARGINAELPDMDADVSLILDTALTDDTGAPTRPITLTLEPTSEDTDLIYGTDRRPPVRQVKIPFDGDIEHWPFDGYTLRSPCSLPSVRGPTRHSYRRWSSSTERCRVGNWPQPRTSQGTGRAGR
jgi:hypothetical protein